MKLFRLLVLFAFLAPIAPSAADACCGAPEAACEESADAAGSAQISAEDCSDNHTGQSACDTCASCHASSLSTSPAPSAVLMASTGATASSLSLDADPTRLVLTPPPSLS